MRKARWTLFIAVTLWAIPAIAEECASTLAELKKSPQFEAVIGFLQKQDRIGLVNETKGSYVVIDAKEDALQIHFYTSGIWDLYGIKDEGPLKFCADENGLRILGLGRSESIRFSEGKMEMGKGGALRTFHPGDMPELLQKLHGLNSRAIASQE
jgi:hypothetical protein